MNVRQMTVRAKLTVAFGSLAAIVLFISCFALLALSDANSRFSGYVNGLNARARLGGEVRTAVDRRAIATANLMLVTKPEDIEAEKAAVLQADKDVTQRLGRLKEQIAAAADAPPEAKSLIADIDRIETKYGPVARTVMETALAGRHPEAIAMMADQGRPLLAQLITATKTYLAYTNARAEKMVADAEEHYATQRLLTILICLASFGAAVVAAFLITRSLNRALGAEPGTLSEITRRVADGDLSPVAGAQAAPAGSVLASMSEMQTSLVRLISDVRTAADSIATGSSQIASGNQDLSSRTEEQAASLEETASSMEELTSTVRQNADNAQQASTLAANASDVAQKGSGVVGQVVGTMNVISESSAKIADITGIIEGIAFQTNILALNAAVEAARAGEQGRGFAVVASEVRSLAQRSSGAAKEIKELIGESVQRVKDGSVLASQAGQTMAEVTQAITRVTDIMGEIAAASTEQSRGIEQVNQAITQMDEVTQQNAALVEEAAAASKSLEHQGQQLNEAVAFFRLEGGAPARSSVSGPKAITAPRQIAKPSAVVRGPVAVAKQVPPKRVAAATKPAPTPVLASAVPAGAASANSSADWQTF